MLGQFLCRNFRESSKLVTSSVRLLHHHGTSVSRIPAPLASPTVSVIPFKYQLHQPDLDRPLHLALQAHQKQYILPTVNLPKISILDPKLHVHECRLPSYVDTAQDKLTPPWKTILPIKDPELGHKVEQILMPLMVRIRHRKMKRHKYHKMRKGLVFLYRKLRTAKTKKKEKAQKLHASKWQKLADEFDAETFVMENISKAKQHNWSIDIVQNWRKSQKLT